MSSSTSNSESAGLRFVLLLALLVCAAELGAWKWLPLNLGRHEVDQRVEEALEPGPDLRAVLLSDSVSYGALDLAPAVEGTLDLSTNRTVSVAGNYFLIARLLESAPNLERVVYVANPNAWTEDLHGVLTPVYFTSIFTRPDEVAEVERLLDRSDLALAMDEAGQHTRFQPPSYLRRGALLRPLADAVRSLGQDLRERQPLRAEPLPAARALYQRRETWEHFTPSDVSRAFLPRLGELCEQHGIRLELMPCPLAPHLLEAWRRTGFWDEYLAWMEGVAEIHETTTFIEECPWRVSSDAAFYDGDHLDPVPKRGWGLALAMYIAGR